MRVEEDKGRKEMVFICEVCVSGNVGGLIRMMGFFLLWNCLFRTRLSVS